MKTHSLLAYAGLGALCLTGAASANDTTAQLGAGGLIFITNPDIAMQSEDLFLSPEAVRVKYEFRNNGTEDQTVLVAFPMPDITGSGDFTTSIPTDDTENIFGFKTTFDGEPVEAELHQYAFAANIDHSDLLRDLDIPLTPYGQTTQEAINALPDTEKHRLEGLGLVFPMEYDDGSGWQTDYVPMWTLRSTYSWEATFPAGEMVEVEHSYEPSYGGTVGVTFIEGGPDDGWLVDRHKEYQAKYCVDDGVYASVEKTLTDPKEPFSAPYQERWLSYIWSTGNNWGGPIGTFTLTVDKLDPEDFISFCWDGEVKKIGPTTFQMTATDFYPPWDRELEILILDKNEPME